MTGPNHRPLLPAVRWRRLLRQEVFGRAKWPFLRQFLRLKHGIRSHDTFSRVFRQLDPRPFPACFVRFMERFAQGLEGVTAVDGKSLRVRSTARSGNRHCTWCTPGLSISG
jgi:hypothetical protein